MGMLVSVVSNIDRLALIDHSVPSCPVPSIIVISFAAGLDQSSSTGCTRGVWRSLKSSSANVRVGWWMLVNIVCSEFALKLLIELVMVELMRVSGSFCSVMNSGLWKCENLLNLSLWFILMLIVVPLGSPFTDGVLMANGLVWLVVVVGLLMGLKVVLLVGVLVGWFVEKSGWFGFLMVGPE